MGLTRAGDSFRPRRCEGRTSGASGSVRTLAVLDAPSYRHLAYRPGVPIVRALQPADGPG